MSAVTPFARSLRWLLVLAPFGACAAPLPSTTALGMGAKAIAQRDHRAAQLPPKDAGGSEEASAPRTARSDSPRPDASPADAAASASERDAEQAKVGASVAEASNRPDAAASPAKWAGLYVGKDVSIYRIQGKPEQKMDDPGAKTRVADRADGGVDLTAVNSADGTDICTLRADAKDKTRKLFEVKPGQSCFGDGGSLRGKVSGGSARFDGKRLELDLKVDIELSQGGTSLSGGLDYHFEGSRN